MTRSFALWAGCSAFAAVAVGAVTVAVFPQSSSVEFPVIAAPAQPAVAAGGPVKVSVDIGQRRATALISTSLNRGGAATAAPPQGSDAGSVGFKQAAGLAASSTTPAVPRAKKARKRQASIGATSGPNASDGLAGSGSGSAGAQSGSPAP